MDYEFLLAIPTLSVSVTVLIVGVLSVFFLVKWTNRSTSHNNDLGLPNSATSSRSTSSKSKSELSKCTSPGCVRCNNYRSLVDNLGEKFDDYLNQDPSKNRHDALERLKGSVDKAVAVHQMPSDPGYDPNEHIVDRHGESEPNPTVFYLYDLEMKPWWERNEMCVNDMTLIENSFATIWDEFSQVYGCFLEGYNRGWISNVVPTGQWNVYHLYNQGVKVNNNCDRCPGTTAVLEKLSTFMSGVAFGNASFSVLQAGTHITEHYGPCNMRVRCHLGLQIPTDCTMTVHHQPRHWIEEGCILFDDSHLHEAKHSGIESDGPRAVFMLDLWNPRVTEEERKAIESLFSLE